MMDDIGVVVTTQSGSDNITKQESHEVTTSTRKPVIEELRDLKDKIAELRYFINRDPGFTKLNKRDREMKKAMLRLYEDLQRGILSEYQHIHNTRLVIRDNPLENFATDVYRYSFGQAVVPLGGLHGYDLAVKAVDINVKGIIYTVDTIIGFDDNGKMDREMKVSIPQPGKDPFQVVINLTGHHVKPTKKSMGELFLEFKRDSNCVIMDLCPVSYVVERDPGTFFTIG